MGKEKLLTFILGLVLLNLMCTTIPPSEETPPVYEEATPTNYIPQTVTATVTDYLPPAPPATQKPQNTPTDYVPPTITAIAIPFTVTDYIPPTASGTPPVSATPPQLSVPESFIVWYFKSIVSERNYSFLWTFLTPAFQEHSGGYSEYVKWWESVNTIDISDVIILKNDGKNARAQVAIAFYLKNGNSIPKKDFFYNITYDATRQTWLFDYR